jgi:hypothetical protein
MPLARPLSFMLDQDASDVDWRQVYGLLSTYKRQLVLYADIRRNRHIDLIHYAELEIILILYSIHPIWLKVEMGEQLKKDIKSFIESIQSHLIECGDIKIDAKGNVSAQSCLELANLINAALV